MAEGGEFELPVPFLALRLLRPYLRSLETKAWNLVVITKKEESLAKTWVVVPER